MAWLLVVLSFRLIVPTHAEMVVCPDQGPCLLAILLIVLPFLLAIIAGLIWGCINYCHLGCEEESDCDDDSYDHNAGDSPLQVSVCPKSRRRREHNSALEMRELHRIPFDGVRDFRYDSRAGAFVDVNYEAYLRRAKSDASIYESVHSDAHGEHKTDVVHLRPKLNPYRDPGEMTGFGECTESETRQQSSQDENYNCDPEGDQLDIQLARSLSCEKTCSRPKSFNPTLRSIGEELEEAGSDVDLPRLSRPLSRVAASNEIFGPLTDLSVT